MSQMVNPGRRRSIPPIQMQEGFAALLGLAMVKIPPGIADCKTFFWKKAKKAYKNA
jgi:hypothetical protein